MTSTKSEEKEKKMINFTTNVPELDRENKALLQASTLLEKMGNNPGLTSDQFYMELLNSGFPVEEHQSVTLAAIAIETMLSVDVQRGFDGDPFKEPTIH